MGRITITSRSAPQLGRTRADFRDDWAAPATYYNLSGPRISGGVTVWATAELRADEAPQLEHCEIRILLGHAEPYDRHYNFVQRGDLEHRLTINGVEIARGQTSTYFNPVPRFGSEVSLSWQLPARTRETAEALLRCVALHWARRDPQFLVFRIHAVHRALDYWQAERRTQMTRAHRDILDRHRILTHLRTVADSAHHYRLAPSPGPVAEAADEESRTPDRT